ncbi:MAG TPA: hypothetical protein VMF67_05500 [Rhizomicrobium sp.]|nr:hypothetical protein [Rhizomicrobium sp.]
MHKAMIYGALVACLATTAVSAQEPAQSAPQNPAVRTNDNNTSNVPVKGANSFTESEAKSRIEKQGYTDVGTLQKDQDGVWRGTAYKDGKPVQVSVDYQGNVNAQ